MTPGAEVRSLAPIDRLLIESACRDLVARAAAFTDAPDAARFAALFTADARLLRPNGDVLDGPAAIEAAYRARPAERITRHLVAHSVVEIESPTAARATSCILLWSGSQGDAAGPFGRPAAARQVVGEFDDRFALAPDGWRIARREARFILHADAATS